MDAAIDLGEGAPLLAEAVIDRNGYVVEEHGSAPRHAAADVAKAAGVQAGNVCRNEKGRHAFRPVALGAGSGENDEGVGAVGKGGRGLFALDSVILAVPGCA